MQIVLALLLLTLSLFLSVSMPYMGGQGSSLQGNLWTGGLKLSSHFSSLTGEPSSWRRHSAVTVSDPTQIYILYWGTKIDSKMYINKDITVQLLGKLLKTNPIKCGWNISNHLVFYFKLVILTQIDHWSKFCRIKRVKPSYTY